MNNYIIYDGDCIFCKNYIRYSKFLIENKIELINARQVTDKEKIKIMKKYNIDNGMILFFENDFFIGSDAMTKIAIINNKKAYFNKILNFFFRNKKITNFFYPYFVFIRNLTLKVRGIRKIFD